MWWIQNGMGVEFDERGKVHKHLVGKNLTLTIWSLKHTKKIICGSKNVTINPLVGKGINTQERGVTNNKPVNVTNKNNNNTWYDSNSGRLH